MWGAAIGTLGADRGRHFRRSGQGLKETNLAWVKAWPISEQKAFGVVLCSVTSSPNHVFIVFLQVALLVSGGDTVMCTVVGGDRA